MEVWTTEPGMQLYSGNFLEGKTPRDLGKGKTLYVFRSAFCMEPSHFPDSPNKPQFPTTVLKPGEWYTGKIVYKFSVKSRQRTGPGPSGAPDPRQQPSEGGSR